MTDGFEIFHADILPTTRGAYAQNNIATSWTSTNQVTLWSGELGMRMFPETHLRVLFYY